MRFAIPFSVLLAAAIPADAQFIHGRVIDAGSGEGLNSASVIVVNPDSTFRAGAVTDRSGYFAFHTTPGPFRLQIQKVGYRTTFSTELQLARSDTLDFAIRLPVQATEIDPLTVVAGGPPLDPSGFFNRRGALSGRFLGPYEVERRRPTSPSDLLNDIPGFDVVPAMGGPRVRMTSRGRYCLPTVYVDGRLAHRGTQTGAEPPRQRDDGILLESLVNARAIRAVEAYGNGADAPVAFRPVGPVGGGDCGVLVFWTAAGLGRR